MFLYYLTFIRAELYVIKTHTEKMLIPVGTRYPRVGGYQWWAPLPLRRTGRGINGERDLQGQDWEGRRQGL